MLLVGLGSDYPDKECPQSRGLRVLAPEDLLLYNLDVSPGETRNLSLVAFPDVVAKLTQLKQAHEAEPGIFGPSEVDRGSNKSLQPCSPRAVEAGCSPEGRVGRKHPVPNWPSIQNFSMRYGTLAPQPPYKLHHCNANNSTESALACEQDAGELCLADAVCGGFALCDWNAKCGQERVRGVAQLFTVTQVGKASSNKPFWTLWQKGGSSLSPSPPPLPLKGEWPLCCQQEWDR